MEETRVNADGRDSGIHSSSVQTSDFVQISSPPKNLEKIEERSEKK